MSEQTHDRAAANAHVSSPGLLDEIRRLGAEDLLTEIEKLAARARAERRAVRREEQARATAARVDAYLDRHPDASGNAVCRDVSGRRQDVLAAVRLWLQAGNGVAA